MFIWNDSTAPAAETAHLYCLILCETSRSSTPGYNDPAAHEDGICQVTIIIIIKEFIYHTNSSELESEALAYSKVGNMASRGGKRGEF